jgi:uncharacterized protein (TIGR00369 family)
MVTEEEQQRRRQWFRRHWESGVPFNALVGLRVTEWSPDAVTIEVPYDDRFSAHPGTFHGGVVSALVDIAATGAVMAGNDFDQGAVPVTLSLSVQFVAVAPGESLVATARCAKRGRTSFVEVTVSSPSGVTLAQGLVTAVVAGRSPAAPSHG